MSHDMALDAYAFIYAACYYIEIYERRLTRIPKRYRPTRILKRNCLLSRR